MKNIKMKLAAAFMFTAVFAAGAIGFVNSNSASAAPVKGADGLLTLENAMTDETAVSADFDAYYITENSMYKQDEPVSAHWKVDGNGTSRIRDYYNPNPATPEEGNDDYENKTQYIASLAVKDMLIADFELTVDFKKSNKPNGFWAAIAFRQVGAGNFFIHNGGGAGFFINDDAASVLWGTTVGGPHQNANSIPNFNIGMFHTLKLSVQGNSVKAYCKLATESDSAFIKVFEHTLQSSFYREGYISLQSVNAAVTFKNLKIKQLEPVELSGGAKEDPRAAAAGTDDSMDKMAGDQVDIKDFNEVTDTSGAPERGCKNSAEAGITVAFPLVLAGLFAAFKRKNRI